MTITRTIYTCGEMVTYNQSKAVLFSDLTGYELFKDEYSNDPVFNCRYVYKDGGWDYVSAPPIRPTPADKDRESIPPECSKECKWKKDLNFSNQSNSLRMELSHLVPRHRCGWNLKPGLMGGNALDYTPCDYI